MLFKKLVLAGVLASGSLFLAGCASSTCKSIQYIPGANTTQKIGGSTFDHNLSVSNLYVKQQTNKIYQAQATITNLTNKRQNLRYRFTWTSASGAPQGNYSAWEMLTLYPELNQVVSSAGPNNSANNFAIQICQVKK